MKKLTHEEFKIRFQQVHPELKLISIYIHYQEKVIVEDYLGVKYGMTPCNLLKGSKPRLNSAINKTEAFSIKLKEKLPQLKVIGGYVNDKTNIIVEDKLKIQYSCKPSNLLHNNHFPGLNTALDKMDWFIKKSNFIHNNKYKYEGKFSKNNKMKIICSIHGEFSMIFHRHTTGFGCPKCGIEERPGSYASVFKYAPDTKVKLYHFKLVENNIKFYKIGLSINPKQRLRCIPFKNKEILEVIEGTVGELFPMEQEIHKWFKKLNINYTPDNHFGGYTECFKW